MNLKAGFPYSLVRNGLPYDYSRLEKSVRTDVLILGGGISGSLMAWELVSRGVNCMVVDGRTIGLGSSCASTSLLQYEIDTPLHELEKKVGAGYAARSYHLCRQSIHELCEVAKMVKFTDFQYKPSLYYAAYKKDKPFLEKEYTHRKQHGFQVQLLEKDDLMDQFGIKAPNAILSKDGAQTNAYMFSHALLQACIKKGVQVYDRTTISDIQHGKTRISCTTEEGHVIRAMKIVYATGYEVMEVINKPIVKLASTYATVSEHMSIDRPFWKQDALIWNTADPYLYMRTTQDNRILVGGRDENFSNPAKRDKLIDKKARQLTEDFSALFPEIDFKPEFNWAGTFGSTKDGLPFIGKYKPFPNGYFALGFGGNGITFSQVAAKIIADDILGKVNNDADIFRFDRV